MQASEIRDLKTEKLQQRLDEAYREMFALRREHSVGRLEDTSRVQAVRRDIARMKTILRERELAPDVEDGGEAS